MNSSTFGSTCTCGTLGSNPGDTQNAPDTSIASGKSSDETAAPTEKSAGPDTCLHVCCACTYAFLLAGAFLLSLWFGFSKPAAALSPTIHNKTILPLDTPLGWKDNRGYTCADYFVHNWCNKNGAYGINWHVNATFETYTNERSSANFSCVVCGGGYNATFFTLEEGTCEKLGASPVRTAALCKDVADSLGIEQVQELTSYSAEKQYPKGCSFRKQESYGHKRVLHHAEHGSANCTRNLACICAREVVADERDIQDQLMTCTQEKVKMLERISDLMYDLKHVTITGMFLFLMVPVLYWPSLKEWVNFFENVIAKEETMKERKEERSCWGLLGIWLFLGYAGTVMSALTTAWAGFDEINHPYGGNIRAVALTLIGSDTLLHVFIFIRRGCSFEVMMEPPTFSIAGFAQYVTCALVACIETCRVKCCNLPCIETCRVKFCNLSCMETCRGKFGKVSYSALALQSNGELEAELDPDSQWKRDNGVKTSLNDFRSSSYQIMEFVAVLFLCWYWYRTWRRGFTFEVLLGYRGTHPPSPICGTFGDEAGAIVLYFRYNWRFAVFMLPRITIILTLQTWLQEKYADLEYKMRTLDVPLALLNPPEEYQSSPPRVQSQTSEHTVAGTQPPMHSHPQWIGGKIYEREKLRKMEKKTFVELLNESRNLYNEWNRALMLATFQGGLCSVFFSLILLQEMVCPFYMDMLLQFSVPPCFMLMQLYPIAQYNALVQDLGSSVHKNAQEELSREGIQVSAFIFKFCGVEFGWTALFSLATGNSVMYLLPIVHHHLHHIFG